MKSRCAAEVGAVMVAVELVWGYSDGSVAAEPGLGLYGEADG